MTLHERDDAHRSMSLGGLRGLPHRTYTISQLCREFGLTPRAVRFYEEQGLIFPSRRGRDRVFSYKDRARLALIVRGRKVSLSIADIRGILDAYDREGEDVQNARALAIFRQRIEALKAERTELDEAIRALRSAIERMSAA